MLKLIGPLVFRTIVCVDINRPPCRDLNPCPHHQWLLDIRNTQFRSTLRPLAGTTSITSSRCHITILKLNNAEASPPFGQVVYGLQVSDIPIGNRHSLSVASITGVSQYLVYCTFCLREKIKILFSKEFF